MNGYIQYKLPDETLHFECCNIAVLFTLIIRKVVLFQK